MELKKAANHALSFDKDDNTQNQKLDEMDVDDVLNHAEQHQTVAANNEGMFLSDEGFLAQFASVSGVKNDMQDEKINAIESTLQRRSSGGYKASASPMPPIPLPSYIPPRGKRGESESVASVYEGCTSKRKRTAISTDSSSLYEWYVYLLPCGSEATTTKDWSKPNKPSKEEVHSGVKYGAEKMYVVMIATSNPLQPKETATGWLRNDRKRLPHIDADHFILWLSVASLKNLR
ncbi:hypothetical protein EIP86_007393 [Pleurotus ostreatoroseus]|nr:hypothetical protein EIP86_007393 [Pleurotus ostreatoroseus]